MQTPSDSAVLESGPATIRVLLVDDHPVFTEGLKSILTRDPRITICGAASSAQSAIQAFRTVRPNVVVADVSMGGVNGIELIKMILAESPNTGILVLSMHDEALYALRALRAGALGYLMKSESPETILNGIQRVAAGTTCVSARLGEQLIFKALHAIREGLGSPVDVLSDRELEVLENLGRGMNTKAIAQHLNLSPKTVETHRAHIKEKLKFPDGTALVRFAVDWVANCNGESHDQGQHPVPAEEAQEALSGSY